MSLFIFYKHYEEEGQFEAFTARYGIDIEGSTWKWSDHMNAWVLFSERYLPIVKSQDSYTALMAEDGSNYRLAQE